MCNQRSVERDAPVQRSQSLLPILDKFSQKPTQHHYSLRLSGKRSISNGKELSVRLVLVPCEQTQLLEVIRDELELSCSKPSWTD